MKRFSGGFVIDVVLLVVNKVTQKHFSDPLQELLDIIDVEPEGSF